jgi:hypothetical protein
VYGCTLGVSPTAIFQSQGGWQFQVAQLNAINFGVEIGNKSRVTGVDKEPTLRLHGRTLLGIVPDLRSVKVTVHRLLHEVQGAEELVKDQRGGDIVPLTLQRQPHATAKKASFATPPGETPRLRLELKTKPKQNELAVDLDVEKLVVASPQLCMGDPPTTRLHLEVELKVAGSATPLTLAQVQDWGVRDPPRRDAAATTTGRQPRCDHRAVAQTAEEQLGLHASWFTTWPRDAKMLRLFGQQTLAQWWRHW